MKKKILVVFKKSNYQLLFEDKNRSIDELIEKGDDNSKRIIEDHKTQQEALARTEEILQKLNYHYTVRWRGQTRSTQGYWLILALGGDGTLLDTSQWIGEKTPLLGINSDPQSSVGKLCAGTTDDLAQLLDEIERATLKPTLHTRLRVRVNNIEVVRPCLNDVLFAHRSPADMSRFDLGINPCDQFDQNDPYPFRCSGIWVSTATGSTAAMRSAGGKVMPMRSKRIQYKIREPYQHHNAPPLERTHGFLEPGQCLSLTSRMRIAQVWADGPHRRAKIKYGERVLIDAHPIALKLYRKIYRSDLNEDL